MFSVRHLTSAIAHEPAVIRFP